MLRVASVLLVFALSGCTPADLTKWVGFGSELSDAGMNYVKGEVIGKRVLIREKCWELLMEDVQELREQDKRSEARALLAEAYMPLTILQAVGDGNTSVIVEELNQARVCQVTVPLESE